MTVKEICDIPDLGIHWFNPDAMTYISSLAKISDKYKVAIDTSKEETMTVHLNNMEVKFTQLSGGLYGQVPKSTTNDTNKYNKTNKLKDYIILSNRQIKWAQQVKQFQNA